MVLRLDPRLPLVWRTPTSLQFGVARPVVVLSAVTSAEEHMIAALVVGVTREGLGMIGRTAGALDTEIATFLGAIAPALAAESGPTPVRAITVVGTGSTARTAADLLASAGFAVRVATDVSEAEVLPCDLAVVVSQFVVDPALHGHWLRRDIAHLSVVLADTRVTIGPIVQPGRTACLYCQLRHRTDADPAWPAIASQLWGRRSPIDTGVVAGEAAAQATRMITAWFRLGAAPGGQLLLDAATGALETTTVSLHPDCGCLEPGASNALAATDRAAAPEAASLTESGSGSAVRRRGPVPAPTRG